VLDSSDPEAAAKMKSETAFLQQERESCSRVPDAHFKVGVLFLFSVEADPAALVRQKSDRSMPQQEVPLSTAAN
jgi:hypothetical protein